MTMGTRWRTLSRGVLGLVLLIAIWWAAVAFSHVSTAVLPSPWQTVTQLGTDIVGRQFWVDIGVSLKEFAVGFVIGAVSGVAFGAAIAQTRWARRFLVPANELFRFVIPFTWVPLATIWFGLSIFGKVFIVWDAVFFFVVLATVDALDGVPPLFEKSGRMLGMSRWTLLWRVQGPAALPRILTGLQIGVATGWIAVIAAEFIGSSEGLGYRIITAQQSLETTVILSRMVVIGVLGGLMSLGARVLARRAVPYESAEA